MTETKEHDVVYIGKTNFRNRERVFGIHHKDRFQHMYVLGQTGTGKSTLLRNLAIQDIEAGRGVAIVDPHGEFVHSLLATIPEHRINDVVYFNPSDTDYPMGFNILEVKNQEYKHLVASGLMAVFTKIWANVWSARMEYILNNTVLALLDTPDTTLLGIPRMLVDRTYRQRILNNVKDPVVKSYWINEYEQYQERFRTEAIAPIQNKVGQFLSTHLIRNIVGQPKSSLDVEDIMNSGKILLVNVSKGLIGEDNSSLLGALLITKIQLAAMERVRYDGNYRDFILHVDEFQNFATDSFASVLSEARKYKLGLVISHQYLGQLITETSTMVRDAIFGNVGTMVIFRVGAADAEFLEQQFAPDIVTQDLVNLPNWNVYTRMLIDGISSKCFSATTLPPIEVAEHPEYISKIVDNSRSLYAAPRKEVEENIILWSEGGETRVAPTESRQNFGKKDSPSGGQAQQGPVFRNIPPKPKSRPQFATDLSSLGIDDGMHLPKPKAYEQPRSDSRPKRRGRRGGGNKSSGSGQALKEALEKAQREKSKAEGTVAHFDSNADDGYSYDDEY